MNASIFPPLHLPPIHARIQTGSNGRQQIFDPQRHRYITLTSEEWVRQHFVSYLIHHLHYPPALVANEISLTLSGVTRRCDTVVYSPSDGQPLMIVEYKAPSVGITQQVFSQIQSYNAVLRAAYLVVSNGLQHFCCRMDYSTLSASFLPELPPWESLRPL